MLKSREKKIYDELVKSTEEHLNSYATLLHDLTDTIVEYCDKRRKWLAVGKDSKSSKKDIEKARVMCEGYTKIINDMERTSNHMQEDFREIENNLVRLKGEAK